MCSNKFINKSLDVYLAYSFSLTSVLIVISYTLFTSSPLVRSLALVASARNNSLAANGKKISTFSS